jgi:uncharacterized protein Yka (UPF0111/DUF47 family)
MDERPITRSEMLELFAAQKADTRAEMLGLFAAQKQEILDGVQEQIRDSQTEILKAFLPYQESTNLRLRVVETNLSNTDAVLTARMAVLERRLQEIEKKLFFNPPAA